MTEYEYAAIVIESDLQRFTEGAPFSRLNPSSAVNSLLAWSVKYGVHIWWAGGRAYGEKLTFRLLEKFWKYAGNGELVRAG